ncbi:hypothetical protein FPZ54_06670 [Sphingomonas suaedae]|uniref:Uncharacterized protein n=1 Tax=Sphingomonas suaedae TaxID=2599297 RepID=A0A518RE52_9SPHN|nr:hypothetical protein FPZ54_06670 [Sphingomonas suaedae]
MVLEDLCDELELYFAAGQHVLRTREEIESEVEHLQTLGYEPLRSCGGKDTYLMNCGFPKTSTG